MRPIPDDVEPVPKTSMQGKALGDGGMIALGGDAGARFVDLQHGDSHPACLDSRHHALRVQQVAPDRWHVARAVMDILRTEKKAQLTQQIDQTGAITGVAIEDVGEGSCLATIGFRNGDFIRSVNGHTMDWATWSVVYQSIAKDGNAVVRFERGGHAQTVLYEIQ